MLLGFRIIEISYGENVPMATVIIVTIKLRGLSEHGRDDTVPPL